MSTSSTSPPEAAQPTPVSRVTLRQMLIVLNVTLATAVYAFTWNSVNVALPHMQGAFSATIDQVAWIMIAFVIGSAAMTASVGFLSDRFGRKEIFLISTIGFLITLVGCALSTTLTEMVVWRFIQGCVARDSCRSVKSLRSTPFPKIATVKLPPCGH